MKLKNSKKSLKNDKPVIYYTNNRLVGKMQIYAIKY